MSAQECARPDVPSGGAAVHIIDSVLVRSVAVIRFGSCECTRRARRRRPGERSTSIDVPRPRAARRGVEFPLSRAPKALARNTPRRQIPERKGPKQCFSGPDGLIYEEPVIREWLQTDFRRCFSLPTGTEAFIDEPTVLHLALCAHDW